VGAAPNPFTSGELVARYEDWYATPFGRIADRVEQDMLFDLLQPLGPGAALVEIGCGTGHFSAALARAGFRVSGVDPSPAMLAVARERVPVALADGLHLPFRDGAFDGAVLVTVLEFVADPLALLCEARRVARRRVAVLTLSSCSWLGVRRRVSGWIGHPAFSRARFRDRAALVALAREAGAPVERLRAGLVLPPSLAGRFPYAEERLSRAAHPCGGILGFALRGGSGYAANS
jgi:SAM-dependent methyltransferase